MKDEEHTQKIIVSAKAVVVDGDKVLILRRSKTDPRRPLTWDLPGGVIDYGESPEQGVIREAREEAGIDIDNLSIIDVHYRPPKSDYPPVIPLFYRATSKTTDITLSYEHDKFVWLDPKDAVKYEMPEYYPRLFALALKS